MNTVTVVTSVFAGWIDGKGRRTFIEFPLEVRYLWMLSKVASQIDARHVEATDYSFTFSSEQFAEKFADISAKLPKAHKRWLTTVCQTEAVED